MGLPILLFAAALAVRVAAGLLFTGPGYLDAFYYVDVARQLAAGHGLNVPFVWAYLEVGGHIPTVPVLPVPADAHWLPLASLVQVPFIWLLGPTGLASGLPFWLAGAAAAPLTYLIGLDAGFERWQAIVGGALVAVPGALTAYMAQPDNFGLYLRELISACRGLCAIMTMVVREAPEGQWIGNREVADKVGENFMDRIQQASRARLYLQQWST